MHKFLVIFLPLILTYSCIKKKSKDPVPLIAWVDFQKAGKSPYTGSDTALLYITYEDGDGDLFTDSRGEGPNLIFTPYYYNTSKKVFEIVFDPMTADTFRIPITVVQPDNGYYKGKSIKGEIFVPTKEFRPNDSYKIFKFTGFMVDMKQHKSNVVTSPVYTINF